MKSSVSMALAALVAGATFTLAADSGLKCNPGHRPAIPARPALTLSQARAAIASFSDTAASKAREVATIPFDYSGLFLTLPYGAENLTPLKNPDEIGVCIILREKHSYWAAVRAVLLDSRRRGADFQKPAPPADSESAIAEAMRDMSEIQDNIKALLTAEAVLNDISADDALLPTAQTPSDRLSNDQLRSILERKKALFSHYANGAVAGPNAPFGDKGARLGVESLNGDKSNYLGHDAPRFDP